MMSQLKAVKKGSIVFPMQSPENMVEERCWLEIDLDAISFNVRSIKTFTRKRVLAVVKANGCGHGLVPVAHAVLAGGAEILGVGTAGEAMELLDAGIDQRILILGFVPFTAFDRLCRRGVEFTVWNREQQLELANAANRVGRRVTVHIWADVNMGRFGAPLETISPFVRSFSDVQELELKGLMGHLPSVEERPRSTALHIARFADLVRELESEGMRPPEVHLSNSDALSFHEASWFDIVRAGVIMYGAPGSERPMLLQPATAWRARILDVQERPHGFSVGYGSEYVCEETERIAVIGVGYADGYRRIPKNVNSVIYRGAEVRVVGRLCTQNCMVALPIEVDAQVGEVVTVLGSESGITIRAEDLAKRWQTNTWDVFCGVSTWVPRVYRGGPVCGGVSLNTGIRQESLPHSGSI
jgi:alanine racemase